MEKQRHLTTPVNNALCVLFVVNILLAAFTEETLYGLGLTVLLLGIDFIIYKVLKKWGYE